jgi:cellobiose phosphorylase
MGLLKNPYGYFDAAAREYVITRPDTPTPWINYLGQGRYGGIISNTAGGYSFDRDPRNRRVTRYRYNSVPADQPGRYIYLRDMQNGIFWSPTWMPVPERRLDSYECRHGAGYTRILSRFQGISANLLYFVPPSPAEDPAPCEILVLRLKNETEKTRSLRSFSYAELSYPDAMIDMTNLDWGQQIVSTRHAAGVLYTSVRFRPWTTFSTSSRPAAGFDTVREVFTGRWRNLSNPQTVERGAPSGSRAARGNNISSFCHDWTLDPGEEQDLIYVLGITDQPEAIPVVVNRFRQEEEVWAAFEDLKTDWDQYLGTFQVATPDPAIDAMLNFWNPVQCRTTLYWSRFVSAYESGLGRGMGTRDSAQDTLGTVHSVPQRARENLDMLWKLQFKDGHTWHQVFPLTGEGGAGLAAEMPDWPQWFGDDHLWLILAACAYLRETGDFGYLYERFPYADEGEDSVWGHILSAVAFTLEHRGPHGLPRTGFSDWDDTMNLDHGSGKAESVWCGMQFCRAMLDLVELSEAVGNHSEAARFLALKNMMTGVVNSAGWDEEWYARAFDDDGRAVGVKGEAHQEIALIPQSWAVIGEVALKEQAEQAMHSAHERLNTRWGLALMDPPYDGNDPRVRGTSTYPPGAKENGGIFCHANTWSIIAAAKLGWNDLAYQYYLVEPYVYSQNVCGPRHPLFGQGRNAWLTGTAAWMYVAGTQWILGIRPTYTGLQIAPCVPTAWNGFTAERVFRGVTYHIQVKRQGAENQVVMTVDGKVIQGNIIPLPPEGTREVQVSIQLV